MQQPPPVGAQHQRALGPVAERAVEGEAALVGVQIGEREDPGHMHAELRGLLDHTEHGGCIERVLLGGSVHARLLEAVIGPQAVREEVADLVGAEQHIAHAHGRIEGDEAAEGQETGVAVGCLSAEHLVVLGAALGGSPDAPRADASVEKVHGRIVQRMGHPGRHITAAQRSALG